MKSWKTNVRLLIGNLAVHPVKYVSLSRKGSKFIIAFNIVKICAESLKFIRILFTYFFFIIIL